MRKITDIINESDNDVYSEVKKLQDESVKLAQKADDIYKKYDDGKTDYSFWDNAPKEEADEFDRLWKEIGEKTAQINKLLKK